MRGWSSRAVTPAMRRSNGSTSVASNRASRMSSKTSGSTANPVCAATSACQSSKGRLLRTRPPSSSRASSKKQTVGTRTRLRPSCACRKMRLASRLRRRRFPPAHEEDERVRIGDERHRGRFERGRPGFGLAPPASHSSPRRRRSAMSSSGEHDSESVPSSDLGCSLPARVPRVRRAYSSAPTRTARSCRICRWRSGPRHAPRARRGRSGAAAPR